MNMVNLAAFTQSDRSACRAMVLGSHILYIEGQNDVNHGQISARGMDDGTYLVRGAALGFDEVTVDDFVKVTTDGTTLAGTRAIPPEWPIHGAIYTRRPDVRAIVHTHAPSAIVFSTTGQALLPISHDACPFIDRVCLFNRTTNTITDWDTARHLAVQLDDCSAAILQNHGIVVLGRSIKEAVILSLMLERACALQLSTVASSSHISSEADVHNKREFIFSRVSISTYWQYYLRKLDRVRRGVQLPELRGSLHASVL